MNKLKIFGQHDEGTIKQIEACTNEHAYKGVLCADGHKGYSMPIGGVVAYKDHISISGVGYDIACGNMAIRTDAIAEDVQKNIKKIMDDVVSTISFGVGRNNETPFDHPLFDDEAWSIDLIKDFKSKAQKQLGTVGSGNHYVDIFIDEKNQVWVGVHFGSRGFGHGTATAFLKSAGGKDGMDVPPTLLETSSQIGKDYIAAMHLSGRYAYAGREYVARTVVEKILQAHSLHEIHNHHNFAWKEIHDGQEYWVVRKGATPAFPGQPGFVGGSMGDDAVIIRGVDSELSKESLYSTVHGAGRIMSRTDARGRYLKIDGKKIRQPGRVRHDEMMKWIHDKGVELRGADLDEAPQAYRRLTDVLKEHAGTIEVMAVLKPIGVAMAGKDILDPYKD